MGELVIVIGVVAVLAVCAFLADRYAQSRFVRWALRQVTR